MATKFRMRVNRVVETESGDRDLREVYLVNTNRQGIQLDEKVASASFNAQLFDDVGIEFKQNTNVVVTIELEEPHAGKDE